MSVLRGDRVLIERRRLDMKQETLASMVGVNRSYISQIERDIDVNVGVKTVQALAVVRAKATGRRWFVEWDGVVWQVIDD